MLHEYVLKFSNSSIFEQILCIYIALHTVRTKRQNSRFITSFWPIFPQENLLQQRENFLQNVATVSTFFTTKVFTNAFTVDKNIGCLIFLS